ncbi:hypothetical protein [Streptosporangium sp. NPDC000396]|uniref:hypothetical protein n=1 Tax=Streptosporangium sp. NPDC000396 TaxID=3366185 RepID=UPI0036ADF2D6
MKIILEVVGTICVIQAVGGMINNLFHGGPRWFLVNHIGFLHGYEIFASIVLGVLGLALFAAASATKKN